MTAVSTVIAAAEINRRHRFAKEMAGAAVEHAIECGKLLAKVKAELGHGEFLRWVQTYCECTPRHAQRYMEAARKCDTVSHFRSLRELLGVEAKPKASSAARQAPSAGEIVADSASPVSVAAPDSTPRVRAAAAVHADAPAPSAPDELEPAPDYDFSDYNPDEDAEYLKAQIEVVMADDRVAAMDAELRKARFEAQAMKTSRDHFMDQAKIYFDLLKAEKRKRESLGRKLDAAKAEIESLRERISIMEAGG